MTAALKKKVLVVDDSHDALDLLEVFLYGTYDVSTALNGFEGLRAARETAPDLIITDIMMPVVDGIKLLNSLREDQKTARIPVIATTSFIKKSNVKSLLSLGFSAVITKPIDRNAIVDAVGKALAQRPAEAGEA
ncbi:MAG TPA: response regulator [Chitinivibrionales bacterium]|nr:response regulator [Chitinivibrionales bacterium]